MSGERFDRENRVTDIASALSHYVTREFFIVASFVKMSPECASGQSLHR